MRYEFTTAKAALTRARPFRFNNSFLFQFWVRVVSRYCSDGIWRHIIGPTTGLTYSNRVHVKLLQKLKTNRVPRLSKQLSLFILTSLFYSRSVENCKFFLPWFKNDIRITKLKFKWGYLLPKRCRIQTQWDGDMRKDGQIVKTRLHL